jgi:hypothetical protein
LDVDDDMSLTQIFGETTVLATKLLDFVFQGIALGFRAAFPRSQSLADSIGPFAPPIGQQG